MGLQEEVKGLIGWWAGNDFVHNQARLEITVEFVRLLYGNLAILVPVSVILVASKETNMMAFANHNEYQLHASWAVVSWWRVANSLVIGSADRDNLTLTTLAELILANTVTIEYDARRQTTVRFAKVRQDDDRPYLPFPQSSLVCWLEVALKLRNAQILCR